MSQNAEGSYVIKGKIQRNKNKTTLLMLCSTHSLKLIIARSKITEQRLSLFAVLI